jgi:hypothetical protein
MSAQPASRAPLSAIEAAQQAIELVGRRLFPFRLERWLPLGFVAFLDSCGRGGAGIQFPGGGGGGGGGGDAGGVGAGGAGAEMERARDWLLEHLVVIVAIAVVGLLLVLTVMAIVLWINSRGVFMYVDNVATGRFDVKRPWREHAERAWSYFQWSFGLALATFAGVLLLLVPLGFLIWVLIRDGASCAPIGGVIAVVLLIIAFALAMGLVGVLLRDFAAPLQIALDVPAGQALGIAWGLVKAHPLTFLAYLVLKILFAIVTAFTAIAAGCLTCCIGFLPVISHTILQPLLYFERAWSLFILRQAGYDLFPAPPPLPPGPPAPPPDWAPQPG